MEPQNFVWTVNLHADGILAPILLFAVLAMLAGAVSYRQVHAFIRTHLDRLMGTV